MDNKWVWQLRAIRKYAHAMRLQLDTAGQRWVDMGLAARWGDWWASH